MADLKYNISVLTYARGQSIIVNKKCNGYQFTNLGGAPCSVNGMIVFPSTTPGTVLGDSRSVGGNEGEIYVGNIEIKFLAGPNPLIEIVQKFYV
jgi:hypothetical protein